MVHLRKRIFMCHIYIKNFYIFTGILCRDLRLQGVFLACVDQLIADKQVNSRRHFALTLKYHAQGISEMAGERRDVPLELIEKAVKQFKFNATYLFTGTGPKFFDPKAEEDVRIRHLGIVTNEKGEERILHVPVTAKAGYGKLHDDAEFFK